MPYPLCFREPSPEEFQYAKDLYSQGYCESAVRHWLDPTGTRSGNRRLESEVLQALVLLAYMCARQSLDIAKLNCERVASVKLHWKEENGLTKIEKAVAQAVFGWILKYPLGTFVLDPSAVLKHVHPDAAKLFKPKSEKRNMMQVMTAMQLRPVEDGTCEKELGKLLFSAGGICGWLRVATLAGRTRTLDIVSWCLAQENFLLSADNVKDFTQNCPTPDMLGEITTELSLLKSSKREVFLEPAWAQLETIARESLDDGKGSGLDFSAVLGLLAKLHLVGEFVINNVVQFWQRLAVPEMGSFAVALQQFAADVDGDWKDPKLPLGTKCLMSTN